MRDDVRLLSLSADRWIIANLDCERDFEDRGNELRRKVLRKLDRLAPLLKIFGEDARLVTPSAWADRSSPGTPTAILAWGETRAVRDLRMRAQSEDASPRQVPDEEPLCDRVWRLPVPEPGAAALANHRSFHLRTARKLGVALPNSRLIDEAFIKNHSQLDEALDPHRLPSSALGWLLKTPFSAAGSGHRALPRDRLPIDHETRSRIGSLARLHGELLLEPLMERLADFGCCALLERGEVSVVSVHEQSIDRSGSFRGLRLAESTLSCPGLDHAEQEALLRTVEDVGSCLADVDYVGAFGIDAWRFVGNNGEPSFQPLGEVNARLTFGFVARCAYERAIRTGQIAAGSEAFYDLRARGDFEADPLVPFNAVSRVSE